MSGQYTINDHCINCGGTGKRILFSTVDDNGNSVDTIIDCPSCNGTGYTSKGVMLTDVSLSEIHVLCAEILKYVKKLSK